MPTADKPRPARNDATKPTAPARPKRSRAKPAKTPANVGDFAKQQAARLESMIQPLIEKAIDGELGAIDRILKILDRLDRYQGYSPTAAPRESDEDARERILRKLSDVDARRAAAAADLDGQADDARAGG